MRALGIVVALATLYAAPAWALDRNEDGQAIQESSKGESQVETTIKKPGQECDSGITKRCTPGQPCLTSITITGEPAKQLFELLKTHGLKNSEVWGEYGATTSQALACYHGQGGDDDFYCLLGYDPQRNVLTTAGFCEAE